MATGDMAGLYDALQTEVRALVAAQEPPTAWHIKERLMHVGAACTGLPPLITLTIDPQTRQVDAEVVYEDWGQPITRHRLRLSVKP